MVRISGETFIRQTIAELTQQISHFEQCIEKAKQQKMDNADSKPETGDESIYD